MDKCVETGCKQIAKNCSECRLASWCWQGLVIVMRDDPGTGRLFGPELDINEGSRDMCSVRRQAECWKSYMSN